MSRLTGNGSPTDNSVRIATISAIPIVLKQLGCDPAAVLAEIGYDLSLFDDPDYMITYAIRSQLIQHCVDRTNCQYFGLLVGQCTGASSLGLVGFLIQHSPDVDTALLSLVRFAHIHVRGAVIHMEKENDSVFLGYSIYQPGVKAREQIEDGVVAVAFNIMLKLCGHEWSPQIALFAHRKPENIHPYKKFFKAPLKFDDERNGIVFSNNWLKKPVMNADPELHHFLQKLVNQLDSHYSSDFTEQVRRVLHPAIHTQQASADYIAMLFSIHPRTLNRRLKACGTSFQQLLDLERFEIAQQLLEISSMDLRQIAATLNYTDASAFTRAFRRWSGMTPSQWRKQNH